MKRIAIFAHYDKNNLIQNFVLYYLSELKKFTDKIIFVSDSNVLPEELKKIENLVYHCIIGRHKEYDFGSYKRGFLYAIENDLLKDSEELIFANDSCYAPLYPFDNMFSEMSIKPLDFWGVTLSNTGLEIINNNLALTEINHIQSYFITFKPQVFNSNIFRNFILSVKKETSKEIVVANYEVKMTKLLENNKFKYDVYSKLSKKISGADINAYRQMIKDEQIPFLKRSITLYKLAKYHYPIMIKFLITKYTKYNYGIINKDIKSNATHLTCIKHFKYGLKGFKRFLFRINKRKKQVCFLGKWYLLN